jgi:hypothetical protein
LKQARYLPLRKMAVIGWASTNFNQMENKFQKLAKELCEKHANKKLVIVTEPHVNGVDKYIVAYEQKRLKNGKYYHGDLIEQVLLS